MWFEPFAVVLALLPLAAYLLLLGAVRLFSRPLVTTSGRDLAALSVALVGWLAIGPMELFFPGTAAATLGPYVWLFLLLFFMLSMTLIILSLPPRLIIYGASAGEVLTPLLRAAQRLDPQAELDDAHRQVWMPTLGVRLRVDGHSHFDTSQVAAFEQNLTPQFWQHLLGSLRYEIKTAPTAQRFGGLGMLVFGLLLLSSVMLMVWFQPAEIASGFKQWLWR
ncbi:hypothetical protein [Roseimaritima ulvae]|uniref:Uncharacterized protein n=1 Tax=Roseimaritima ulvae TaxID=980254 RepID=A0A5B9QMV2_9BACT|nr:hypothetical protein [Roseimaritima ulvae]QEG40318.1 hypothetical protein UC8_23250 [Roseimaritima ulvae]